MPVKIRWSSPSRHEKALVAEVVGKYWTPFAASDVLTPHILQYLPPFLLEWYHCGPCDRYAVGPYYSGAFCGVCRTGHDVRTDLISVGAYQERQVAQVHHELRCVYIYDIDRCARI